MNAMLTTYDNILRYSYAHFTDEETEVMSCPDAQSE